MKTRNDKIDCDPDNFKMEEQVGMGAYSLILKTLYVPQNRILILKQLDGEKASELEFENYLQEIDIHRQLKNPGIVCFYGSFSLGPDSHTIVMDYCENGDLHDFFQRRDRAIREALESGQSRSPEETINENATLMQFMYQVAGGLNYMHSIGILHLDMKPENILIDVNHNAKISDFGTCLKINDVRQILDKSEIYAGTRSYWPPELLFDVHPNFEKFDSTIDVWAFGCIVHEILYGIHPFMPYEDIDHHTEEERECQLIKGSIQAFLDADYDPAVGYDFAKRPSSKEFFDNVFTFGFSRRALAEDLLNFTLFKDMRSDSD